MNSWTAILPMTQKLIDTHSCSEPPTLGTIRPTVTWAFIWLMVGLKIPIIALGIIVWRAIHAEPAPPEEATIDGSGGGSGFRHPRPPRPRAPRRGPHGAP